jgi:hypothetical protein
LAQSLQEQLGKAEAGARAWEDRTAAAGARAEALQEAVTALWQRSGCHALGLEELLGSEGVTVGNLMQHLGIIEQRVNELMQVLCPPAKP